METTRTHTTSLSLSVSSHIQSSLGMWTTAYTFSHSVQKAAEVGRAYWGIGGGDAREKAEKRDDALTALKSSKSLSSLSPTFILAPKDRELVDLRTTEPLPVKHPF